LWDIPSYLLKHPAAPGFHAPWLWCGWFGTDFLFKVVETYYPDDLVRNSWGEVGAFETVFQLPHIIIREFNIPERFQKLLQVEDVVLPNGKVDLGFAVGSNFEGLLPFRSGECLECITRDLFGGKEPEWILDNRRWKWVPQDRKSCTVISNVSADWTRSIGEERPELRHPDLDNHNSGEYESPQTSP